MNEASTIAIIGTGNVGAALGTRFARAGYSVVFGTRRGGDLDELLARCDGRARATTIEDAAAAADVIVLAVPGNAAVVAARGLGDVTGKVIVDCTNALRWDAGPVWTPPPEGSNAAAIAAAIAGARVVKAFNTFGAEHHADPDLGRGLTVDVFIASDDADARRTVAALAERSGFTPIDAGPLRNAAVLENVAILWIHLATVGGLGREFAIDVVHRLR